MRFTEEKKIIRQVRVLENYPDRTISILVDDVPWRISPETLEKMKNSTLRGGVNGSTSGC